MPIRDFRDLTVWKKSVELAVAAYDATSRWPRQERFGLIAQVRSAAISVSSNIAEGNGRGSTKDYIRFLRTAKGSLNEVRSLSHVSVRLQFATEAQLAMVDALVDEISRMLTALIRSLSRRVETKQGAIGRSR
jgi:four helix bundle protein